MKSKIILLGVAVALVIASIFALKGFMFLTRVTSTPVVVSSGNSLFKVDENGKMTKLTDGKKDFYSMWPLGFYKDNFIYTEYPSLYTPIASIKRLDIKTLQSRTLTEGIAGPFYNPILINSRVIFESVNPYRIWSVDLDDNSKVNLAKGLVGSIIADGISLTESEYIVSKDAKWITFIAYDPTLKKDCYFSSTVDGSQLVNLTGNVSIPLTALDSVVGHLSPELTGLSEDGIKVFFAFANNGRELSYITSIDGSLKTMLPYGYFVSFLNNDTEVILLRDSPLFETYPRSIWKVSTDGKIQKNLTQELDGDCYGVKLSPSENKIVFTFAQKGSQDYSLWVMNIDGSGKVNLVKGTKVSTGLLGFLPKSNKVLYLLKQEDNDRASLWMKDLENETDVKLMEEKDHGYTVEYISSTGKYLLLREEDQSLWLVSTGGNTKERLNGKFGSNMYSILNDILLYNDSQDNSLYKLDLMTGKKLKIKENFFDTMIGQCQISNNGKDTLIVASTKYGISKYYLFNTQNRKLTDLNEIVKGDIDFVNFFP